jgi:HlyD family secretion protein
MERREAAALVAQAQAANKGAETALGNARHEQAILVTAAQQQLDRARTALNQARQRRAQAAAGLDGAKERGAQAATAVAQAGHLATQSQAQLDLVLAGTRAERLAQAAAAVQLAEATHAGAGQALGNARQALADRFAYRAQVAATEAQASGSRARLDAAQAALDLALAGNTNEVIEAARADLRQAVAAEGVARARLADTVIRAPASGTISELILRQGEGCTPGSVIVRMLDLKHLWVRIYLPVPALERIRLGQPCTVAADAFPAKRFPGKVLTCSPQAEFTPKNTQTVDERVKQVFWVKVDIGDGQGLLKPGVPVDVTVTTTDHQP